MQASTRHYVPAAGQDWALPLYDPLLRLFRIDRLRERLIDAAELRSGHALLDIGCGTGSLVVKLKRRAPDAEVRGLDPDPKALARARAKVERAGLSIELDRGFSDQLPYADQSFDRVFSSFMFHHLEPHEKRATLREVFRVLKPQGRLHLLDFREDVHQKGGLLRRLHRASPSASFLGQIEGGLESLLTGAGFLPPRTESLPIFYFGLLGYYHATRP